MGYCIDLIGGNAVLPAANQEEAMARLVQLDKTGHKSGGSWGGGQPEQKWFSWVDQNWIAKANGSVQAALEEWRFYFEPNEQGDLVISHFEGEKMGDEDQLFNALSSLMTGFLEFMGEDGMHWRVHFGGDKTTETVAGFPEDS